MKRITTVISGTGKYEICKDCNGYWAIEHEYIGEDGRLKQQINGLQGCLNDTCEEAIKSAIFRGRVKEWQEIHPEATENQLFQFMASVIQV